MLVVISSVVGEEVHPAVVRVGLLARNPLVVLSDEMADEGMEGGTEAGGEEEVSERLEGDKVPEEGVHGELEDPLRDFPVGEGQRLAEERAERVERELEAQEEELLGGRVEKLSFPAMRQVRVTAQLTLESVVKHVVLLEGPEGREASKKRGEAATRKRRGSEGRCARRREGRLDAVGGRKGAMAGGRLGVTEDQRFRVASVRSR